MIVDLTIKKLVEKYGGLKKLKKDFYGNPDDAYSALLTVQEELCNEAFMKKNVDEVIEVSFTKLMDYCDNNLSRR